MTSTTWTALRTVGLTKEFRGFTAVDSVDLAVAEWSVHALVGPNGAGKTTLFNMLTGFLSPSPERSSSTADITGLPPEQIARLGVARSFQITSLFAALSARDHVELALQARTTQGLAVLALGQADAVGTAPRRRLLGESTSPTPPTHRPGARLRAEARAGTRGRPRVEPRLLLLDEPTAGMGAEDIEGTVALVRRIAEGRTVVFVDHNMSVVKSLADRVTVLQQGQIIAEGPYDEVRADPRVITAYLGDHDAEVRNLSAWYGEAQVLHDVSLESPPAPS